MKLNKDSNNIKPKSKKILYCTGNCPDKPLVYVIRGKQGDLLIDTGHEDCLHQIDRWILRNDFDIKWIFLTHAHFDHTWNARFFKQKYGARVILHENDKDLFVMKDINTLYPSSYQHKDFVEAANKLKYRDWIPMCKIDKFITDEDTDYLRTYGFDVDIVMLPGHTGGSMGILQNRVLYAGDAVAAKRGDYYTSLLGEDIGDLYESEKKIFEINPLVIAPGHGQLIINERAFENL